MVSDGGGESTQERLKKIVRLYESEMCELDMKSGDPRELFNDGMEKLGRHKA